MSGLCPVRLLRGMVMLRGIEGERTRYVDIVKEICYTIAELKNGGFCDAFTVFAALNCSLQETRSSGGLSGEIVL